jgi:predicted molibdopterin-dependent oxidoreductase YjgC
VDVSTSPQIQAYLEHYEARPDRFGPQRGPAASRDSARAGFHAPDDGSGAAAVSQPVKTDNELYVRDYGKCILCYKCVEACGVDAQNTFAIAVAGRGFDARISTEFAVPLPESACVYCGNCIAVCPTGALMFVSEHQHVQDQRIVKVSSPLENNTTHGNLCIKGRFGWQFVQIREKETSNP